MKKSTEWEDSSNKILTKTMKAIELVRTVIKKVKCASMPTVALYTFEKVLR